MELIDSVTNIPHGNRMMALQSNLFMKSASSFMESVKKNWGE